MKNKLREIMMTHIRAGNSKAAISKELGLAWSTVSRVCKVYLEHGTTGYLPHTGLPKFVHGSLVNANNKDSARRLSRDFNMISTTMERVIKEGLGLKSMALVTCQQLTQRKKNGREVRGKMIPNRLQMDDADKVHVFLDEEGFRSTIKTCTRED